MTPKRKITTKRPPTDIEKLSVVLTRWVGSTRSLIAHTVFFVVMMLLAISGVGFDKVLLILTTIVSLEAIYLSIFIQMSVNRQAKRLREVSEDIVEIQEDVEEIQEDVEEIQEDVEDITEDVGTYEKEDKARDEALMSHIHDKLAELIQEVQMLKDSKRKAATRKTTKK